jgi:hypothetical protein
MMLDPDHPNVRSGVRPNRRRCGRLDTAGNVCTVYTGWPLLAV